LLGNTTAVKALKEGEERGIKDYEKALHEGNLAEDCQAVVRTLLPRTRAHLEALNRLLAV
jgi:hypothetical protein